MPIRFVIAHTTGGVDGRIAARPSGSVAQVFGANGPRFVLLPGVMHYSTTSASSADLSGISPGAIPCLRSELVVKAIDVVDRQHVHVAVNIVIYI